MAFFKILIFFSGLRPSKKIFSGSKMVPKKTSSADYDHNLDKIKVLKMNVSKVLKIYNYQRRTDSILRIDRTTRREFLEGLLQTNFFIFSCSKFLIFDWSYLYSINFFRKFYAPNFRSFHTLKFVTR